MARIGFDLGEKKVIKSLNIQGGGHVASGQHVKIYVDGKLVAEGTLAQDRLELHTDAADARGRDAVEPR